MKNLVILSILFAVSVLDISCSKSDAVAASGGTMSATINGVAWSSTVVNDASTKFQRSFLDRMKNLILGSYKY
jgi:hypothetical protein